MRKLCLPLPRILLSFFIVAAACCGGFDAARADDPLCQVTGLRGSAALEHAGSRSALIAGTALSAGDMITTNAGARVKLRFADGSEVRLGENAALRIEAIKVDAAAGTRNILLSLPMGLLRAAAAKLSKSAGSSFEIHTGVGYSAVRGTHWIVSAKKAETRVYVQEGRVAVGADFESSQVPKMVEPNRWVSVTRKAGIGAVQDVPAGSLDGLIEQTEASLAPGDDDAESVTETAFGALGGTGVPGAATDTVSNVTNTVDATVDQATGAVSAATDAVTSTVDSTVTAVGSTAAAVTDTLGLPGSGSSTSGSSSSGGSSSGTDSSSSGSSSANSSNSSSSSSSSTNSSSSSSGGSSSSSGGKTLGDSVRDTLGKVGGGLL